MLAPTEGFGALDSPPNADDDGGAMVLGAEGGGGIENAE